MNKKPFLGFSKIITVFFIILSFKSIASSPEINNIKSVTLPDSNIRSKNTGTEKIVITGTIKSEDGKPLEKAKIIFDTTIVALTDKDGKFSFEPGEVSPVGHNIYFSCDSFVTTVRSYYPVMSSASYNIILRKQFSNVKPVANESFHAISKDSAHISNEPLYIPAADSIHKHPIIRNDSSQTTGAIVNNDFDFPSILFKTNATGLSSENKAFLDIISEKLKNNLTVRIDIKAYTPQHDYNPLIAQKRLTNIFKYLVQKGVVADRLNKITVAGGGEVNTIDLVKSEE